MALVRWEPFREVESLLLYLGCYDVGRFQSGREKHEFGDFRRHSLD